MGEALIVVGTIILLAGVGRILDARQRRRERLEDLQRWQALHQAIREARPQPQPQRPSPPLSLLN
jgi:uncharacterized membrane protein HdeD (DUF308 family)